MKRLLIPGEHKGGVWIFIAAAVVAAAVAGWLVYTYVWPGPGSGSMEVRKESIVYHCPMHPTYTSDKPGECPICGMNLVPVENQAEEGAHGKGAGREPPGRAPITVTETQRQMIGVKTAHVMTRDLSKEIRTVGSVAYDPDLAVAQREFIEALRLGDSSLVRASEERLELMGMSRDQIAMLKQTRRIQKNLYLPAPEGKVWIYGDIYEADIPYVKVGQGVEISVTDHPELVLRGTIAAIDPVVKSKTRTVRIRTEVADPEGRLKPNLYVNVYILVPLGESLSVPASSLLWSDGAWYVFVDEGNGRLVPRVVSVGGRTKEYAQITGGLSAGEVVVESASFLIDAESQLKGTLRSMEGGSDMKEMEGTEGHKHMH